MASNEVGTCYPGIRL